MSKNPILGGRVWCPLCDEYIKVISVHKAAEVVDMHSRTIYRYIEEGKIQAFKIGGTRYRVCSRCLVRPRDPTRS